MSFKPFLQLAAEKKLGTAIRCNALYKPFYKLSYLTALKNSGLMDRLRGERVAFERLASVHIRLKDRRSVDRVATIGLSSWAPQ